MLLSFLAGSAQILQAGVNGVLGKNLNSSFMAGAASNIIGFAFMFCIALFAARKSPVTVPALNGGNWWMWMGGFLSAFIVMVSLSAPFRVGFAVFTVTVLCGQLIASIIFDAVGAFGSVRVPIDWKKILGIVFLFGGVYLVKKG